MHLLLNEQPQAAAGPLDPQTLAQYQEYEKHFRINPLQAALFNSGLFFGVGPKCNHWLIFPDAIESLPV